MCYLFSLKISSTKASCASCTSLTCLLGVYACSLAMATGQQEPEPTFWVGGDQMYKVRHVAQVRPKVVECPECRGEGKVRGFVPVES